jgi:hypothetical protein
VNVPDGYRAIGTRDDGAIVRADLAHLDVGWWWGDGAPLAGAKGRGGVVVRDVDASTRVVLRDYRRGGVLGPLRGDRFGDPGRARSELEVHAALRARGVACVEPLAAIWRRNGRSYRLRFATRLVDGAMPVPTAMAARPSERRHIVTAVAAVVGTAFRAGLRHPDLHPDNLIVDPAGVVSMLDFDRARVGTAVTALERDAMLLRMARYLFRHRDRLPVRVSAADRMRFLRGLVPDRATRRVLARSLSQRLRRIVARHAWAFWR